VICLSGRGDKDVQTVARAIGDDAFAAKDLS
jgi:tryptophan synthase beta subunit